MGFIQKIKETFGGTKQEKPVEKSLEGLGISVLQDKKLKEKLDTLQELFDELESEITEPDPLKYVGKLHDRLKMLNRAIHSLAFPNYRAGTITLFRELLEGWVLWNSLAEYWLNAVEDRITAITEPEPGKEKEKTQQKPVALNKEVENTMRKLLQVTAIDVWTLVRRLHTVFQMHVFQDGQLVLAESYLREDVAPSHATIIKTVGTRTGIDLSELKEEKI